MKKTRNLAFLGSKFAIVGAANTILGFVIFSAIWVFSGEKLDPMFVLAITYALVFFSAYLLQRRFVFRSKDAVSREMPKYLLITVSSVVLNGALLYVFTEEFGTGVLLSQAFALAISSAYSFIGHLYWTFKSH
jgi:putative flippase GtrA